MKPLHGLLLVAGAVAFSACAASPPAVPDRALVRPPPIGEGVRARIVPAERETPSATVATLDGAIETALLNNPLLRADFARFEAAALAVPQASSLMDPRVSYTQFVDGVQTRTGEQEFAAIVSQMFPWFGRLRLQGSIARSDAMQALESYRASMLDVRHQVQSAWHRLAYEQAAEALAREDRATLERTVDAAATLYGAGRHGRAPLLKAQTELARIENELTAYPARIAALREELARLLHVEGSVDVPMLDGTASSGNALPDADALVAEALALRPEVEGLRLRMEQAELRHELARKDYYPDFTLGLNYVGVGDRPDNPVGPMAPRDEGEDAWGVTAGFNIPIPNARRRAARQQALKLRDEADWRRLATESVIEDKVRSTVPMLDALDRQLDVLRSSLLPLAEEARATNEAAYVSGQATLLDLLDAQRTLIAVRRDVLRTRRDYLLAAAELERAVGGSFDAEEEL